MKARRAISPAAVLCAAVSIFCFAAAARGATYTWDASGNGAPYDGSGTWSYSGSNWWNSGATGTPPGQTDMAVFGAASGSAGTVTVSNYGNAIYSGSMTFNAASSGTYLVTGDPIDLGGSSGTATIVVNASSGTIGSLLETYNNSLIMSGKGALYLTNAVYAGTTKISGSGELYLDCPAATTAIAVTAGTLGGSGGASGAAVTVSTKAGIEAGSGGLGTLTLGGLNFNGTSAEIKISNVSNYASTPAIVVTNNNGLVADGGPGLDSFVLGGPAPSGSGTVELMQYTGTVGGSGTAAFGLNSGGLTGLSSRAVLGLTTSSQGGYNYLDLTYKTDYLVWTGAGNGIWVTSPNLTVSGTTNWVSGLAGTATNFIVNDAVVFSDSATGATNVSISGTGNVSPGSVTFDNNNLNYTLSSTAGYGITGNASLTMNGSGSVTISNSNGYSGGTIVNAGALYINNAGALGSGTLTINGGTIATAAGPITPAGNNPLAWNGGFTFAGSSALNLGTGSVTLGNSAAVTLANTAALTIGGPIAGNGTGFTQNGAGLLVLTGSSSYSGPTNVNGGTLSVGNGGGGASIAGTSGVNLGANTLLLFNQSGVLNFAPAISGSGSVAQAAGVVSLDDGNNSYTGGTLVSGGTLQLGNAAALSSGSLTVNGGAVDLAGYSPTLSYLSGTGGTITLSGTQASVLTLNQAGSTTFGGTLFDGPSATLGMVLGGGSLTLPGTNQLSGQTTVQNLATLRIEGSLATANLTVSNSAMIAGAAGAVNLTVSGSGLTYQSAAASTFSGSIGGLGGVTVNGPGSLTFNGAGTYTGTTTVNGGTMVLGPQSSLSVSGPLNVGGLTGTGVLVINSTGIVSLASSSTTSVGGISGNTASTGAGAIIQNNGNVGIDVNSSNDYLEIGTGAESDNVSLTPNTYGYYLLSGGSLTTGSSSNNVGIRVGAYGLGVFTQTGGSLADNRYLSLGDFGVGEVNFLGGAAWVGPGFRILVGDNAGTGILNLGTESGGDAVVASTNVTQGLEISPNAGNQGTLNLNSGTLQLAGAGIQQFAASPSATGTVNLNGGVLQGLYSGQTVLSNANGLVTNVYARGAVFDQEISPGYVTANLTQAGGDGVYPSGGSIAVTSGTGGGGSGYIGQPLVGVTGGSGSGATAIADISGGSITGITLTSPGQNYQVGDVLTFTFSGGGAASAATSFTYTLTASDLASNVGGLTKIGPGLLNLSGTNTYAGTTDVTDGTLQLGGAAALGTGALVVNAGALDLAGYSIAVSSFSGASGIVTNSGENPATLNVNQSIATTFSGALNDGASTVALTLDSGTLTLSPGTPGNIFMGGTLVAGGELILTSSDALAAGSALTVGDLGAFSPLMPPGGSAVAPVPEPGTLPLLVGVATIVAGMELRRARRHALRALSGAVAPNAILAIIPSSRVINRFSRQLANARGGTNCGTSGLACAAGRYFVSLSTMPRHRAAEMLSYRSGKRTRFLEET